jgi:Tfp pilus assembly protein PilF
MVVRRGCLLLCVLTLGCHALPGFEPEGDPAAARGLWEQGQDALRKGEPERAIGLYEQSLSADPAFTRSHMSLAAAHLEAGHDKEACEHLARYLQAHPEHTLIRSHYAELLLRLRRPRAARCEFERFSAEAQDSDDAVQRHLVHAHTRLMEIAEGERDEYAIRLNRALGLYWLARQRAAVKSPRDDLPAEGLLWRAAGELDHALRERPGEARPCWYLYAVWSLLGQKQVAHHWLRRASDAAPYSSPLTPAEWRSLTLACYAAEDRPRRLSVGAATVRERSALPAR